MLGTHLWPEPSPLSAIPFSISSLRLRLMRAEDWQGMSWEGGRIYQQDQSWLEMGKHMKHYH